MNLNRNYDVVGIGNAIVDIISEIDDFTFASLGLEKSSMNLIDEAASRKLQAKTKGGLTASGGSVANTMVGLASFGGASCFLGKVATDFMGHVFAKDIAKAGVDFKGALVEDELPTATSVILVTPDHSRTMNTHLGISTHFSIQDLDVKQLNATKMLMCEGYLWDRPAAKEAIRHAISVARDSSAEIALTLSDSFCVERHRSDFKELLADSVNVLFANNEELEALYETDLDSAVKKLAEDVEFSFVTMGAKGSMVVTADEVVEVAAEPADVVDTTGAGDQYAAGVLYGLTHGYELSEAARLGSLSASEVISHLGPRPEIDLSTLL